MLLCSCQSCREKPIRGFFLFHLLKRLLRPEPLLESGLAVGLLIGGALAVEVLGRGARSREVAPPDFVLVVFAT